MEVKQSISEAVHNLRMALHANLNWEVQFMDVKHLNDLEAEYREEVRAQISFYRAWKKTASKQRDVRVIMFSTLKGDAIKKNLEEHIAVYKTVRAERKFLTDVYFEQLKPKSITSRKPF